eukprot:5683687-Amphidinium_carterae.1
MARNMCGSDHLALCLFKDGLDRHVAEGAICCVCAPMFCNRIVWNNDTKESCTRGHAAADSMETCGSCPAAARDKTHAANLPSGRVGVFTLLPCPPRKGDSACRCKLALLACGRFRFESQHRYIFHSSNDMLTYFGSLLLVPCCMQCMCISSTRNCDEQLVWCQVSLDMLSEESTDSHEGLDFSMLRGGEWLQAPSAA